MTDGAIRERRADDLDRCAAALALVHRSDGYPANWPADPVGWLAPTDTVRAWVATLGGATIVGHLLLHPAEGAGERVVSVGRLFVVPAGRGLGLGGALLERARTWAAAHHLDLVLEVTDGERSAIALYERTGWRRTGTVRADWTTPGGGPVTLHRYVLDAPA